MLYNIVVQLLEILFGSPGADTKGRPQGPWPTHLDQGALDSGRESRFVRQNCPCGGQISHTSAPIEGKFCVQVPQRRATFAYKCPSGGQNLRRSAQWRENFT